MYLLAYLHVFIYLFITFIQINFIIFCKRMKNLHRVWNTHFIIILADENEEDEPKKHIHWSVTAWPLQDWHSVQRSSDRKSIPVDTCEPYFVKTVFN